EDRVPALVDETLQAVDAMSAAEFDAEVEDVATLLVDDGFRQAEARDLGADHAARLGVLVEDHAVIAERREIARDRERGGAATHQGDAPAGRVGRGAGQARAE